MNIYYIIIVQARAERELRATIFSPFSVINSLVYARMSPLRSTNVIYFTRYLSASCANHIGVHNSCPLTRLQGRIPSLVIPPSSFHSKFHYTPWDVRFIMCWFKPMWTIHGLHALGIALCPWLLMCMRKQIIKGSRKRRDKVNVQSIGLIIIFQENLDLLHCDLQIIRMIHIINKINPPIIPRKISIFI